VPQVGLDHALDALVFQATGSFLGFLIWGKCWTLHSAEFGKECKGLGKKERRDRDDYEILMIECEEEIRLDI
jgi:hypothetical protein